MAAFLVVTKVEQTARWRSAGLARCLNAAMPQAELGDFYCPGCARAKAYRLPIHHAFLDGRSDHDWHRSIVDYLRWRAGYSWRPMHHSGPCLVDDYRDAVHLVVQRFHAPAPEVLPSVPRKPQASVSMAQQSASRASGPGVRGTVAGNVVA